MIPVKEGLWTTPSSTDEKPQLIANRCPRCGEIFFPQKPICINCQNRELEDIRLSHRGKIFASTIIMQAPGTWYRGPVPYAIGYVELPEGTLIETLFTDCDIESLEVGMDVEMVIEKLHEDDEGNEIMAYKFRPVKD